VRDTSSDPAAPGLAPGTVSGISASTAAYSGGPRLRLRVLAGRRVALIGDNVIPVVQGQAPGIAAGNVGHRRAGAAGGHAEDRARGVQRPHDGADAVPGSPCYQFGGLPARGPAPRGPPPRPGRGIYG